VVASYDLAYYLDSILKGSKSPRVKLNKSSLYLILLLVVIISLVVINEFGYGILAVCRQNIWDRESSLLRCGFPVSKIILRTVVSSANAFAAGFVS
jgi:uncharacterized membrane protein (Fun14 family)